MDTNIIERLAIIETEIKAVKKSLEDITNNHLHTIYQKIEKISNRPSWAVVVFITFLSSLSIALITRSLILK